MMAAALAAGEGAPPADYGRYESMIAEMDSIHLGSGEAVFHQGDTPEKVYFVTSGRLDCEYDPQLDRQGAGPSIAAASAAAVEKLGWKAAKAKARAAARAAKGQGGAPASGPGAAAAPEDAPAVSAPVDPAASDDREQRPRVVATLRPGDHFGETAMLEGRDRRNLTVRCVAAACELRAMSFPRFSAFLRESSQLQQTVERAAEMRTNQRIRKVIEAAAQADLTLRECARGEIIFRQVRLGCVRAAEGALLGRAGGWAHGREGRCTGDMGKAAGIRLPPSVGCGRLSNSTPHRRPTAPAGRGSRVTPSTSWRAARW